jgi:murein DD-endopeptidase MepM/ murein hydrolase activator NlpD
MAIFPLPKLPDLPFDTGGRAFGAVIASRGGRAHAACDLIVSPDTEVYAVASGIVHIGAYEFIPTSSHQIQAIEIWHPSLNLLIRYGEITVESGLEKGAKAVEGQVIGKVAKQSPAMLHIEMFKTNERSNLSQNPSGKYDNVKAATYNRRHDLVDPTPYLHQWKGNFKSTPAPTGPR